MYYQSAVLCSLIVGIIVILMIFHRRKTYWQKKGIPYVNSPPVIGIMWSVLLRTKSISKLIQELYNSHPESKYVGMTDVGYVPVIMINDLEIVKDIAVKNFDHFMNHRDVMADGSDSLMSKNIFALKNERWREMRTTLTPSFTANKMKHMFTLIKKCSTNFVDHLKNHDVTIEEIDLKDVYTRYTNDVIATAAFGIDVDSMKNRDNEFYTYGKDAVTFDGFTKTLKFLVSMIFPKFARFFGIKFLSRDTEKFFRKLIDDTVRTRRENGTVRPDMIHLLMQTQENDDGPKITNDDIVAQAFIFFLAGFDTVARLMCWVTLTLAHNPQVQQRLRREIDEIHDEQNGVITYETLTTLKYLDQVVSETLRLYGPQPFMDRICNKPYKLPPASQGHEEFVVQPGTVVWFPIFAVHRDPNYFPNPEIFDPERFNDDNKNDIRPYSYMPFGVGPRKCIADRFALMETKILVISILRSFVVKPSSKTPKEFGMNKKVFMLEPEMGFWVSLEKRRA